MKTKYITLKAIGVSLILFAIWLPFLLTEFVLPEQWYHPSSPYWWSFPAMCTVTLVTIAIGLIGIIFISEDSGEQP